tara:strand:+ start:204 stop:695 length:492 start_codon:yes stop_codon:yes gene_type:complete
MDSGAVYTDFSHLASLRSEAKANPKAALEDVAAQFESLFLQMMLKSMRDATMDGGLFQSDQMDTYQSMADQQIALKLSEQGGVGLARMMVEQMQVRGYVPSSDTPDAEASNDATRKGAIDGHDAAQLLMPRAQVPASMRFNSQAAAKAFALPAANSVELDVKG